jgi:hypothetical protein
MRIGEPVLQRVEYVGLANGLQLQLPSTTFRIRPSLIAHAGEDLLQLREIRFRKLVVLAEEHVRQLLLSSSIAEFRQLTYQIVDVGRVNRSPVVNDVREGVVARFSVGHW